MSLSTTSVFAQDKITPPPSDQPAKADPILLVLGGFRSCATVPSEDSVELTFENSILEYRSQVLKASGRVPKVVRGCFVNTLEGGNVYYFTGLSKKVMSLQVSGFFADGAEQSLGLENLLRALMYAVVAQSKKVAHPIVFIAGHSQGGWLAAEVAASLIDRGIKVGALMTLDPISPLHCNQAEYLVRGGSPAPGCLRAPSDWDFAFSSKLLEDLDSSWFNFYQSQFLLLHSGPISALDKYNANSERTYSLADGVGHAHSKVANDLFAWSNWAGRSAWVIRRFQKELQSLPVIQ